MGFDRHFTCNIIHFLISVNSTREGGMATREERWQAKVMVVACQKQNGSICTRVPALGGVAIQIIDSNRQSPQVRHSPIIDAELPCSGPYHVSSAPLDTSISSM